MLRVLSRLCGSNLQKKTSARVQRAEFASNRNIGTSSSRNDSLIEAQALAAYFYALMRKAHHCLASFVPYKGIQHVFANHCQSRWVITVKKKSQKARATIKKISVPKSQCLKQFVRERGFLIGLSNIDTNNKSYWFLLPYQAK